MDGFATVFSSSRSLEEEEAENSCDRIDDFEDGFATSGERALNDSKRHRGHYDSDRRNRREIANSNERKRMQSINAGFQSLRGLVCPKTGEKLSKAAILKYAAEFINALMRDKQQLIADKRYLEQVLTGAEPSRRFHSSSSLSSRLSPTLLPARKRWRDTESSSSDEGIGFASTDEVSSSSSKAIISELRRQVDDLKQQLEMEKKLRLNVEMDRERLEQLQQQQQQPPTPPQPSLSYQRTMSSSSSSSFSSSASDASSLDLVFPPPTTSTTTTSSSSSKDLHHNSMWRRNLETIVEAIRHVEGDSGLFASPEPAQPERHGAATEPEPTRPEAVRVTAPLTEIQVHPIWLSDFASQSFLSSPDTVGILHPFHRSTVTVPSS